MEECRQIALHVLVEHRFKGLVKASQIGAAIWPQANFKAQGAGAAGSRILRKLIKDGLARWDSRDGDWGYEVTAAGCEAYRKGKA